MKATGKRMPIKGSKATAPISKGVVKTAQSPAAPAGFPAQQAKAYRKPSKVMVAKRGAAGSKG